MPRCGCLQADGTLPVSTSLENAIKLYNEMLRARNSARVPKKPKGVSWPNFACSPPAWNFPKARW
jgi:hypothetical protein